MGKTRYSKAQEILSPIVGKKFHKNKIWRRIMIDIGGDRRTIIETMRLMIDLGMIKEVKQDIYKVISSSADI